MDFVSLNGRTPRPRLILLPYGVNVFTDVVLISLYVIGCRLLDTSLHDFLLPFTLEILWRHLWHAFVPFRSRRKPPRPPPEPAKQQQTTNRHNRLKLRGLLLAAATMPSLMDAACFHAMQSGITSSRSPKHHVLDTSKLSGMNLEAVSLDR